MTIASAKHKARLSQMNCLIAQHFATGHCAGRIELHHVAEGSGKRSEWALVPLCTEHHTGKGGLHGMGPKAFLRCYRPPGESEYGLLVWLMEDLAA